MTAEDIEQIRAIVQTAVAPLQAAQAATDAKIGRLDAKIDAGFARVDAKIDRLDAKIDGRFDQVMGALSRLPTEILNRDAGIRLDIADLRQRVEALEGTRGR